jgi:hypothetical protein
MFLLKANIVQNMKTINLFLVCSCFLILSVFGADSNGATPDNYGCVSPNSLGCFPNGALVCVNPTNDPNNCGRCSFKCPAAGASPAVAAKCTSTGCQCNTSSKQCGTSPGTCEIITVNNCDATTDCTACTAPVVSGVAGQYCLVSGVTSTCNTLAGCVPTTSTGTGTQPNLITVPGSDTLSPAQCNNICNSLGTTNFYTLSVDVGFDTKTNTTFDLATANAGTCNLGSDNLSYYGATTCTDPTDPSTCSTGSWQVYNSS